MPAKWTGEVVAMLHCNRITKKELAKEIGWHEKYLSQILNGHSNPPSAEQKIKDALERIIERRTNDV